MDILLYLTEEYEPLNTNDKLKKKPWNQHLKKFFVVITMKAFLGYCGKKKKIKVMKFFEERECACVRKRGRERMRVCMREKG